MRGDADRAATIAADSCSAQASSDRSGVASAGAARSAIDIPRAIGASVDGILRVIGHQHFGNVGITENNRSSPLESLNKNRILLRDEPETSAASTFKLQSSHSDRTLDADRNPVEWTDCLSSLQGLVYRTCFRKSFVASQFNKRIQIGIDTLNSLQMNICELK